MRIPIVEYFYYFIQNFTTADITESIVKESSTNLFMKEHSRGVKDPIESAQIRGKQHVIGNTFVPTKLDINDNVKEEQKANNVSCSHS